MTLPQMVLIREGPYAAVLMLPSVWKEFSKADAAARATIVKIMELYSKDGPDDLLDKHFKFEGRHSVGDKNGSKVRIEAFKAWQVRVYGGHIGKRFICSEIDTSKKQDKADQLTLARAAKNLAPYI